jgi:hypothetical protein
VFRRRLAAAVGLATMTAALPAMPGAASGAQADDQALVRVAHFAPGLALLLLIGGGLAAATGFVVQQRRWTG